MKQEHVSGDAIVIRGARQNNLKNLSLAVPTVEREVRTGLVWSMAIAGGMPSTASTCGLSIRSRNCRAYGLKVST